MRLAEHVAHTTDVDGMLAAMTPEQFNEWCAKDRVEPIGDEATRQVLALLGCMVAKLGGCDDPELKWFIPWIKEHAKPVKTWAQVMQQGGLRSAVSR
jgi:hypothetical protein